MRHRVGVRGPVPWSAVLSTLYGPCGGGSHKYRDQPLDQSQSFCIMTPSLSLYLAAINIRIIPLPEL